jgi:hypothetical protein
VAWHGGRWRRRDGAAVASIAFRDNQRHRELSPVKPGGIAPIHARGEYHGDIHDDNIMIRRQGINFEVKLLDFFDLGRPTRGKIHKDVLNLVEVFHVIVGGRDKYARQPKVVKDIIRGGKDSLVLERFQSAGDIQRHLETLTW